MVGSLNASQLMQGFEMPVNYTPFDSDALLREQDAADLLSLSVRTLQSWRIRMAGPPFVQVGRAVRYRRRDLIAWIDANTIGVPMASQS
jgi:hypothetical protein